MIPVTEYPVRGIRNIMTITTLASNISLMHMQLFLLDGPPAIFFIGGFLLMIVIPVATLIFLIIYFVRRNKKKKQEGDKNKQV